VQESAGCKQGCGRRAGCIFTVPRTYLYVGQWCVCDCVCVCVIVCEVESFNSILISGLSCERAR
jgi:hypothetical protein